MFAVALYAEGVDRNFNWITIFFSIPQSPSTRRAWIEIDILTLWVVPFCPVALYAEGVDRNKMLGRPCCAPSNVALYAEGVDRNQNSTQILRVPSSRPLRGGRG